MKKKIIFALLIFLILVFIILKNYNSFSRSMPNFIKENLPENIVNLHFKFKNYLNAIKNPDYLYNALFLPETQFANLEFNRLLIKKNNEDNIYDNIFKETIDQKYFIDLIGENVLITTFDGNIFFFENNKLINNKDKNIEIKYIKNNLEDIEPNLKILDSYVYNEYIYVSAFLEMNNENEKICKKMRLFKAKINFKNINFEKIYENNECAFGVMQGGRIQKYKNGNKDGLLFTSADNETDSPNNNPQEDNSHFGKIIFLDLKTKETKIFSKGHRNPQGLYVNKNLIISTEHGPKGGDEINRIIEGGNYGWPIASYGTYYNYDKKKYLKNHEKYGFLEPIFNYNPAIGISEIVKIPTDFMKDPDLENIFFISSLNGKSLFLTKFSSDFNKVILTEKIFINQRIRELKYIEKHNVFLLALEKPSQLAILKNINLN